MKHCDDLKRLYLELPLRIPYELRVFSAIVRRKWTLAIADNDVRGDGGAPQDLAPSSPHFHRHRLLHAVIDETHPRVDGLGDLQPNTRRTFPPSLAAGQSRQGGYQPRTILTSFAAGQFEEIFVLNLPERTDRRDAMTLIAAVSGVQLTFVSGIRGGDVLEKTIPRGGRDRKPLSLGRIGSWRAHMNVLQRSRNPIHSHGGGRGCSHVVKLIPDI